MVFLENILKFEEQITAIEDSPFSKMPRLGVLIEYSKRITKTQKQIGLGRIVFSKIFNENLKPLA